MTLLFRSSWAGRVRRLLVVGTVAGLLTTGCTRRDATETGSAGDEGHAIRGVVVSVDASRGTLLVDHEAIAGFMPAMTMEFMANPGDVAVAREGMRIRGRIFAGEKGWYLEQMWPADESVERTVQVAAGELRNETATRGLGAFREIGEALPAFSLFDQNGAVVQAARFRGRQIVVNFIFTRCPDANMCPASTARMKELQQRARDAGVSNLQLVSITLDPAYDTPGVLRDYAQANGIDTSNFTFLTGPEGAIKDLMAQLGILAYKDGPLLRHTLSTTLVDETGRIVHREQGSGWRPAEFVERLRRTAEAPVQAVAP